MDAGKALPLLKRLKLAQTPTRCLQAGGRRLLQERATVLRTAGMGRFADDALRSVSEGAERQISVASDSERASSTSTPRYRTVFSILLWPSRIWIARKLPVAL